MVAGVQVFQGVLCRLRGVIKGCRRPGKGCRKKVSSLQSRDFTVTMCRMTAGDRRRMTTEGLKASIRRAMLQQMVDR